MSLPGVSVLLMVEDDDAHAALALRALAKSEHIKVHVVATVADARAFLRAHPVDLVLSDLKLPDGSGLELLETGVPLVVQTSQGNEARAVAAMQGGALDYCVKSPEMFHELPRIIERALKRHELEIAVRQAQKMQAVGQLAGGVAHDFNNMLAAIMSAADELALAVTTPASKELCALILQASERAAELTRNLLSFSRMGKVRSAQVDVHQVIREVVLLLERSIDRRVIIRTELAARAHTVSGDAAQLQSAFLNLGINARDAMPHGGELRIVSEVVQLDQEACSALPFDLCAGAFLEIKICDSGSGISQQVLPYIFEPFFTTKEPGKGTGMGLAAVYGAVVEHRGALTVQSQVSAGTVFRMYLPLSDSASVASDASRSAPPGSGLVLLVDDEPLVLASASLLLKSLGYDVVTARDGLEAYQQFQAHRAQLVAVVCDAVMPVESGPAVLQRIAELAPTLPCVLCSGFSRDPRLIPADAHWVLLPKPFRREDLAQTLSRAIAARAAPRNGVAT